MQQVTTKKNTKQKKLRTNHQKNWNDLFAELSGKIRKRIIF